MSDKKKLLFIASQPYFQWRGSPIRVAFDVQALAENGWEVDLFVLPFGDDRDVDGVKVVRAVNPFGFKRASIGPSFAKACFDFIMLFRAWGMQHRHRYDVIHCVEDTGLIGVFLKILYGTRFVFEKHSDPSSYKKGFFKNILMSCYAAVERACVRNADAVICTGPGLTEQAKSYGTKAEVRCISDIPSSLVEADEVETQKIRGGWELKDGEVVAAYVGSFAVYQGIDLLFECFAAAAKKSEKVRLLVVGGSESEIEERKAWLKEQGCADRSIFIGKIAPDRLPAVLAAADILVSPRISGVNTPLKILDYLKAGAAILAADTEANRLLLDEQTALFAKPDAAGMADGLCRLVDDSTERARLAASGRRLIDEKYNFTAFRESLNEAYRSVGSE